MYRDCNILMLTKRVDVFLVPAKWWTNYSSTKKQLKGTTTHLTEFLKLAPLTGWSWEPTSTMSTLRWTSGGWSRMVRAYVHLRKVWDRQTPDKRGQYSYPMGPLPAMRTSTSITSGSGCGISGQERNLSRGVRIGDLYTSQHLSFLSERCEN